MNAPSTSPPAPRTSQAPLDEPVHATDSRFPTTVSSPVRARNSGDTPAAPEDQGDASGNELLSGVRSKRTDVERYLRAVDSRRRRLATVTIVAAAVATLLTAPAALGGKPLADWLNETLELSAPSWRILCAIAAVCSLIGNQGHSRDAGGWHHAQPSQPARCHQPVPRNHREQLVHRAGAVNPFGRGSPSPCGSGTYRSSVELRNGVHAELHGRQTPHRSG